mgnify:CR=1 FL=1
MILQFNNLTLGYDLHPAVHHLTLGVQRGALLALTGPNGAGKSTLLKGIMGQLRPLDGSVECHDIRRNEIAYLPQLSQVDRRFPITVDELVSLGAWKQTGAFGRLKMQHKKKVGSALEQIGLAGFEKRLISTLSGGQMQRVLFARLLMQEANLILLDEPFTAIDSKTTEDLLEQVALWHQSGKTVIAVLHELNIIRGHFPETLLLSRQPIAYGPTETVLTDNNLSKARQLNEAFDEQAGLCSHA